MKFLKLLVLSLPFWTSPAWSVQSIHCNLVHTQNIWEMTIPMDEQSPIIIQQMIGGEKLLTTLQIATLDVDRNTIQISARSSSQRGSISYLYEFKLFSSNGVSFNGEMRSFNVDSNPRTLVSTDFLHCLKQ